MYNYVQLYYLGTCNKIFILIFEFEYKTRDFMTTINDLLDNITDTLVFSFYKSVQCKKFGLIFD